MRHLAVICALAALPGCFILSAGGDDTVDERGGKHTLTINYHLKGPGGVPVPCPAGFANLLLSATTDEMEGQQQTLVPCDGNGTQTMELFTSGRRDYRVDNDPSLYTEAFSENYNFILYLTDPTGSVSRAASLEQHFKLDGDKTIEVDLYPDAGFFLVSWELYSDITSTRVVTCPAVAVDEVELRYRRFTPDGDPPAPTSTVRWPCDEVHPPFYRNEFAVGQGFTMALAPEDYVGELVGYRNGAEVARDPDINFNIRGGDALTEHTGNLRVLDR